MDYGLPDLDGLETTRLIRAGAWGFIVKTAPTAQLLDAVRKVSRNQLFVSMPILEKLDLRNNADMTRFAIRRNLIHLE